MGHILRGHIPPGGDALVDTKIGGEGEEGAQDDSLEVEADQFACELLSGKPMGLRFDPGLRMSPHDLAQRARALGEKIGVDPGAICLFYAKSTMRWPVSQLAIALLGADLGGSEIVRAGLAKHLHKESLSESASRFLESVCGSHATDTT